MFAISIDPVSREAGRAARERIDNLTKPVGSLGRLEDLAERLASIAGGTPPSNYERRAILVGAGDHGVTAEGVSAYPSEVTPQMVGAFLAGFAAINALGRAARAEIYVADFGIATALPGHPRLLQRSVGRGTRNFAREAAMTPEQVDVAAHQDVEQCVQRAGVRDEYDRPLSVAMRLEHVADPRADGVEAFAAGRLVGAHR